ncbi:MAG: hypothetical protein HYW49_07595 [Deltaproteobacteria bacterium]|nr:hypothetical protein [Deltaproteobacteria bacterium]
MPKYIALIAVLLCSVAVAGENHESATKGAKCQITCGKMRFVMRPGDEIKLGETEYAKPEGTLHEAFKKSNCKLLSLNMVMNEKELRFERVEADPPTMYGVNILALPEGDSRKVTSVGPVSAECVRKGRFKFKDITAASSVNEASIKGNVIQHEADHGKGDPTSGAKPIK